MKIAFAVIMPALATLSLAGCAQDVTSYPSLAPRPIEKLGFAEPAITPAEAKPDPVLDAKIGEMAASLDRIAKSFAADAARAETAGRAARGAAVGSDPWLEAQTALAQLDDWRAQASSLVTDIDQAASDRAASLAPAYPGLTALRERAQAEADRENATIKRLQDALPAA